MTHTQKGPTTSFFPGTALPSEVREELITRVVDKLVHHQVGDMCSRCNCGTPIYSGKDGSVTLTRHRAEKIVDEIITDMVRKLSAPS